MIGPTGAARVMLTTRPVDFRKGTEGLAALVRKEMQADPIRLWRGLSVPRQARGPAKLVVYPRLGRSQNRIFKSEAFFPRKNEQMAREGILLQVFLDQRRKSIAPLAHIGLTERRCTFTPAGTTIMMPSPCRRTAVSPPPDCCRPAQRRAVHLPARMSPSRSAVARRRVTPQAPAPHTSRRRRAPASPVAAHFGRSDRAGWWRCHGGDRPPPPLHQASRSLASSPASARQ